MIIIDYKEYIKECRIYKITWTKEKCADEALKYQSRNEFRKGSGGAYSASVRNGWMDELCKHMGENKIKKDYWTKERCAEEALKYNFRHEFEKGSPTAYVKSGKMGWKDEICKHMISNGNRYNRCVYAIEFPDNCVYIGLSYNLDKRFLQHLNDTKNNSIVLRHFKKTGLTPVIKQLTDYIDVDIASKLESQKVIEYIQDGWTIINIAKCGNVGGKTIKWTKERCQKEALKYKTRNEFKIYSPNAYRASIYNRWMDELCSHMKYVNNPSGYWTKERCREESIKYKNKESFKKAKGAFGSSYVNGWLDEFFPKKVKNDEENI